MDLERAKELLKVMILEHQVSSVGGEPLSDDDMINYLFTLDFTEEELLELGFTEDTVDSVNMSNMSAGYDVYKVTFEEDISQTFRIRAESMEAAEEKAIQLYKSGKLVVDNGNLVVTQVMVENEDGTESTSWREIYS